MPTVNHEIDKGLIRTLAKMKKKDLATYRIILKQIDKILENPEIGKPLRSNLFGLRRVHIGRAYVLSYTYDKNANKIVLLEYEDWDNFYKRYAA